MTKADKEKFEAELERIQAQFAVTNKSFEGGPAFSQALQTIGVKELLVLICRILLSA